MVKNKVSYLFDQRIGLLEKILLNSGGIAKRIRSDFPRSSPMKYSKSAWMRLNYVACVRVGHGDFHLGQILNKGNIMFSILKENPKARSVTAKSQTTLSKMLPVCLRSISLCDLCSTIRRTKTLDLIPG